MALAGGEIDAASFTTIRLLSGAITLAVLWSSFSKTRSLAKTGNWKSAFFLFAYALCFSFAYLGLTAGTGALILFGCVQLSMIGLSIFRGDHPGRFEWAGLLIALTGLLYLVFPGLTAPPLTSAALMSAAGIAWGSYTLRGKGSSDPLGDTAGNFIRSVPMIAIASLPFVSAMNVSGRGVFLAVLSGAVASGIGYTAWYTVLKNHTAARAAVMQLSVPLITAIFGVVLLSEAMTPRLSIAAGLILGGIGMTIVGRRPK
jgi:drug/metabolite transporter (DMT)-like permease